MWRNLPRNILATLKKSFLNMIRHVPHRTNEMPGMALGFSRSISCPDFQRVFKDYSPSRYAAPKAWSQTSISQPCRVQRVPSRRLQFNNARFPPLCNTTRSAIDFLTSGCGLDYSTARLAKGYSTERPFLDCFTTRPVREYSTARPVRNYSIARPVRPDYSRERLVRDYSTVRPVRDPFGMNYPTTRSTTDCSTSRVNAPCWSSMNRTEGPHPYGTPYYPEQNRSKCDPAMQSPDLSLDALRFTAHCNLLPSFCYPSFVPPTTSKPSNFTTNKTKEERNSMEDMVNTFAYAGAVDKATGPAPGCGPWACTGPLNTSCTGLPPPGNPPQCVQYITGYYYYPYGTWFCGPYHVNTGTVPCNRSA